jgi:hypothetical protein
MPILKQGSSGPAVKDVQQKLKTSGLIRKVSMESLVRAFCVTMVTAFL